MANIIPFCGTSPQIDAQNFLAVSADVIGEVTLAERTSVWNNVTIRGDVNFIRIGRYSNIQDGSTVHVDKRYPDKPGYGATIIGERVTIGHGVILHACTIEDCCLIGMGSIVLDGAIIGKGSIVGAGAVVTPGTVVPPFSLVLGTPGKVVKTLPEESLADRIDHAERYWELSKMYSEDA